MGRMWITVEVDSGATPGQPLPPVPDFPPGVSIPGFPGQGPIIPPGYPPYPGQPLPPQVQPPIVLPPDFPLEPDTGLPSYPDTGLPPTTGRPPQVKPPIWLPAGWYRPKPQPPDPNLPEGGKPDQGGPPIATPKPS